MKFITPNDMNVIGKNDSESIQNAVDYAVKNGINSIKIPRKNMRTNAQVWEISKAILLPSNFTVVSEYVPSALYIDCSGFSLQYLASNTPE